MLIKSSCVKCGNQAYKTKPGHGVSVPLCWKCWDLMRWYHGEKSPEIKMIEMFSMNECFELSDKIVLDWINNEPMPKV